jgi:hypothetical protein
VIPRPARLRRRRRAAARRSRRPTRSCRGSCSAPTGYRSASRARSARAGRSAPPRSAARAST